MAALKEKEGPYISQSDQFDLEFGGCQKQSKAEAVVQPLSQHMKPLGISEVYRSYWNFAAERQRVFFRRLGRQNYFELTDDVILQTYRFTNAYRASDRVSQYLIRNVIYNDAYSQSVEEVFFRILLFKLFNKIETWEALEARFGLLQIGDFDKKAYGDYLTSIRSAGATIYSAAYIMSSGRSSFGSATKHLNHLALIEHMLVDDAANKIAMADSMEEAFRLLRSYPLFGDFLAYQLVIDFNYSELTDFSENDFVMPGPGALDGISKCFPDVAGRKPADIIKLVCERQAEEFDRYGIEFPSLWGRQLHLIDCQNLFCEISKYARVAHPDVPGVAGRTRIKQKFSPASIPTLPWYPPKWGLNDKIAKMGVPAV